MAGGLAAAGSALSLAVELRLKAAADAAGLVLQAGKRPPGGGTVRRRAAPVLAEITTLAEVAA